MLYRQESDLLVGSQNPAWRTKGGSAEPGVRKQRGEGAVGADEAQEQVHRE